MYGTQTTTFLIGVDTWFENDVKMYGTQTGTAERREHSAFENDVKMYGTQTKFFSGQIQRRLRMM